MEELSPQLRIVMWCRFRVEMGLSLRKSLEEYFNSGICNEPQWINWWRSVDGRSTSKKNDQKFTPYSMVILQVLERGLNGEPIQQTLHSLEEDLLESNQADLDQYASSLAFKALFPLILFLIPAFFLLLVGPIIKDIMVGF